MSDILGQFLRYLHYILIGCLKEGLQTAHLYPSNPKAENLSKYFDR